MAKMTKAQAEAKLQKIVAGDGDRGYDLIQKSLPKLKKASKDLQDELKKAESPEMVDTLVKSVRLHLKPLAEGIALLTRVLAEVKKATDDEEMFALLEKDLTAAMKDVTTRLEAGRNAAREAKQALDAADDYLRNQDSDADSAGEDWTTAFTEFIRMSDAAAKEAPAFAKWEADAKAAAAARDKAKLEKIRKAKPASAMLDKVAAIPKDKRFVEFEKKYRSDKLPKALGDEIQRDRVKAIMAHNKVIALAQAKDEAVKRVQALAIEPRNGHKALDVLELPSGALGRLQALLDGPDAALPAGLEALAKANRLKKSGKEMVAALKKAGVL